MQSIKITSAFYHWSNIIFSWSKLWNQSVIFIIYNSAQASFDMNFIDFVCLMDYLRIPIIKKYLISEINKVVLL